MISGRVDVEVNTKKASLAEGDTIHFHADLPHIIRNENDGESFLYLDTFAIDSSNSHTKFLKARLSDSSVVWVYDFATVLNAKPAVIIDEVPLYMRPDLLTITAKRMNTMEIIAVIEEWDDWIKVVN